MRLFYLFPNKTVIYGSISLKNRLSYKKPYPVFNDKKEIVFLTMQTFNEFNDAKSSN